MGEEKIAKNLAKMPQSPLISFEYVKSYENELQNGPQNQQTQQQTSTNFINGVPVMTHPTVNGNVKHSGANNPGNPGQTRPGNPGQTRPGYQVFRAQPQENLEVWLHGPR